MRLIFAGMLIVAGMIGIGLGGIAESIGRPGYGIGSLIFGLLFIFTGVWGGHREEKRLNQRDKQNQKTTSS